MAIAAKLSKEEVELDEKSWKDKIPKSIPIEALLALDDARISADYGLKGEVVVNKKDLKRATEIVKKYKVKIVGEEVELDEVINFGKMSDKKLKAFIAGFDSDEPMGQQAGMQLKAAKKEAKKRGIKEGVDLDEKWEVGVVYHQDFGGGEVSYFRADSLLKNRRWKGMGVDEYGGKQKKPRNITADEKTPGWETTPKNEIPKALKEEVEIDEGKFKKGDIVIPNMGPHKGDKHEIIHDFGDGSYNIKPLMHPRNIKYKLGASKAKENQLKLVKEEVEVAEADKEALKRALAISKWKKAGGKVDKQPDNIEKWWGQLSPEDQKRAATIAQYKKEKKQKKEEVETEASTYRSI